MEKVTARKLMKMKGKQKIAMITAYDYFSARIVDEAGVDAILVGDSLGMVVLGLPNTLRVTMEDMVRHTEAVARARPRALVVGDMPFLSYEVDVREAVVNAGRLAAAGADAVKLEGGEEFADRVRAIVRAGIPVMGHIGLTPQRYLRLGGYRLVGKKPGEAEELLRDAEALQEAGVFAIVIEHTVPEVAEMVTRKIEVPTICIGAGPGCDGQVLVFHDLLGLNPEPPYFAKKYADLAGVIREAVARYVEEVRSGAFPGEEYSPPPKKK